MLYISANLKFLRKRKGLTQDDVASSLKLKRSTYSGYENDVAQPALDDVIRLAGFYNVSVDLLLQTEISLIGESQLLELERGMDPYIRGTDLRVLTSTVDGNNNENIELVNEKAKAGYKTGFADPEYIKVLPTFSLPFLSKSKKYRTFQISGDSMLPIPDRAFVTGEFVHNWNMIRDRQAYLLLTLEVLENRIKTEGKLILYSLNPLYKPYELAVNEIREIWRFVHYISSDLPEPQLPQNKLIQTVAELKNDVEHIKNKIRL
jgi:transcriptional regulator with XRE-family HTH domain